MCFFQMSLAYGDIDAEQRVELVGCIPGTPLWIV
jgi:hypothetical protein